MPELITSPSNPKINRLLALQQKSSARRERGLFVVEGQRELQHCIDAGFEIDRSQAVMDEPEPEDESGYDDDYTEEDQ